MGSGFWVVERWLDLDPGTGLWVLGPGVLGDDWTWTWVLGSGILALSVCGCSPPTEHDEESSEREEYETGMNGWGYGFVIPLVPSESNHHASNSQFIRKTAAAKQPIFHISGAAWKHQERTFHW